MSAGVHKFWNCILSLFLVCMTQIIPTATATVKGNETDQLALLAFKEKIVHDPQGAFSSWNMSLNFCSWAGITCSQQNKRVTSINLASKGFVGSLPRDIGNMSFLTEIVLTNNTLQGTIPQQVDRLFRLKVLSLGRNALEGNIPDTLGRLHRLVILELFSNNLSGTIPTSVFNLSTLNVFNLANNQLQGSIPSEFGLTHRNLQKIQLSNNRLSGNIPISLSNASKLQVIHLQFNNFTGPISVDFGRLLYLQNLSLEYNNLGLGEQGDLKFFDSLINCSSLKVLKLGANNLQGSLPRSFANLSMELTMISLADNWISGSIPPAISKFINLIFLSLEHNNFTGIIPPEITELGKLQRVLLYNNRFSGNIPASIGNLSMLDEVHLENNDLNGTIPSSFGNCPMLVLLDLSQNNLSGTIPDEFFHVSPFSAKLNLSRNHLVGSLPAGIGALETIVELDISENEFSGLIPTELGRCLTLDTLYMQGNFFRGHISHSMPNLRGMQNLDLSRNNLSGEIPDYFANLPLKYLNLSWNHLEGEVHTKGVFTNASAFWIVGNKGLCGGIPELRLPRCSSDRSHKRKMDWVQVLFMIVSVLVVLIVGRILWLERKETEPISIRPISVLPIRLSYKLLYQATDGFSRANLISEGGFGSVYKGELGPLYSGKAVAIKVFNEEATNSFSTECEALQNIRHRNIVKIRSTSSSTGKKGKKFKAIVYDFMENGSLDRWQNLTYRTSPHELSMPQILNLKNKINIAIDVASALDYLHNQLDYPLIHCNLRPSNIFLDTEMSACVSNFGLAKFLIDRRIFNGFAGPSKYAPPEYYQGSMVSTKGDVYSYGIILLEMLTGKMITGPSFHGSFKLQTFVSNVLSDGVNDVIDPINLHELGTYDATKANDCLVMLLDIGVRCALESPKSRPDIKDTLNILETVRSVFEANTGGTQMYAKGSLQAAVLMALRNKRSLLWNRLEVPEVPSQNLGERNSGRTDWTVATARQLMDPTPQMAPNSVKVSYMDLHEATDGFSSANLVGAGGFGSVYKGTFNQEYVRLLLRDSGIEDEIGIAVAIKVFNLQRRGAVKSFNTEYQTLNNIAHTYLVKLIATCTSVDQDGHDFRAILFEFMDHGSLEMWLHPTYKTNLHSPTKPRILSLYARISIAIDVAYALDYLHHQCKSCIIHCDLKPANILIDKNMSARIADFGLAITLPKYQNMNHCSSSTGIRGTTGYIAPEYGLGCKMTTKGDTYSFGILFLEMLTGKKPTHRMFRGGLTLHNFVSLALPDDVINITDPRMTVMTSANIGDGKRVEDCLTRMFNIGLACSKTSPKNRPDMCTVLRELESIRNSF